MKTVRVHVTQELIDAAEMGNANNCAIAFAIKFANADLERIRVTQRFISASSRDEQLRYTWKTTPRDAAWIGKFDEDKNLVSPITIKLVPAEAVKVKPVALLSGDAKVRSAQRPKSAQTGRKTSVRELPEAA